MKANHKNVTISLPEPLLRKLRVFAAHRSVSMTKVIQEAIEKTVGPDDEYAKAMERFLKRLENPPDLGTQGKITWKREDLYERVHRY